MSLVKVSLKTPLHQIRIILLCLRQRFGKQKVAASVVSNTGFFENKDQMRLSGLGCYGETFPLKNAKGEISINGAGECFRSYYYY